MLTHGCCSLSCLTFGGNQVEVIDEISVLTEVWRIH